MPPQGLQLLLALGQGWAGAESPFGGAAETPKCGELLLSPQPGLEQSTACDTLTWCAPPKRKEEHSWHGNISLNPSVPWE